MVLGILLCSFIVMHMIHLNCHRHLIGSVGYYSELAPYQTNKIQVALFGALFTFMLIREIKKASVDNRKVYRAVTATLTVLYILYSIFIIGRINLQMNVNYKRHCHSNIRVIQAAVELYNLDNTGPDKMLVLDLSRLKKQNYLKNSDFHCPWSKIAKDDETAKLFSYRTTNISNKSIIFCPIHGNPEWTDKPKAPKPNAEALKAMKEARQAAAKLKLPTSDKELDAYRMQKARSISQKAHLIYFLLSIIFTFLGIKLFPIEKDQ